MDNTVTLRLPDRLASVAQEQARRSRRSLEDVLVEWLDRAASDMPIELLSDQEIVEVARGMWTSENQERLAGLLALNREAQLTAEEEAELDALMSVYRRDTLRKAQAYAEGVSRGLLPRLS